MTVRSDGSAIDEATSHAAAAGDVPNIPAAATVDARRAAPLELNVELEVELGGEAEDGREGEGGDDLARQPLLIMRGVEKRYAAGPLAPAVTVLRDISLTIRTGEWISIIGQSGSGKSTLMHLLGCLDRPTAGTYRIIDAGNPVVRGCIDPEGNGEGDVHVHAASTGTLRIAAASPDTLARYRRHLFGFIFQRYHLLDHLTALDNVALPARYLGHDLATRRARAAVLLDALGLGDRIDHRPAALSGGQQQRVSLARALMNGARVILADEPTGALDSESGVKVMALLARLHRDGYTIIVVTHDRDVAAAAERIVELRDGRIVSDCPNADFTASHDHADRTMQTPEEGKRNSRLDAAPRRDDTAASLRTVWARCRDALFEAAAVMQRHRLRCGLMALSLTMGIAAVVLILAVGAGARAKVVDDIRKWGADATYVFPGKGPTDQRASIQDALRLEDTVTLRRVPFVESASALAFESGEARRGSKRAAVSLVGTEPDFFRLRKRQVLFGEIFSAAQMARHAPVVVLDAQAAAAFFTAGSDPTGERLLIDGRSFIVAGVIEAADEDDGNRALKIFLPLTTLQSRVTGGHRVHLLMIGMVPGASSDAHRKTLEAVLLARHREKDFHLISFTKFIDMEKRNARTMSIVMLCSALIALTVGGIGVMNIMLVAVRERMGEIAIRMAVGARRRDIARQFLLEAALICIGGGLAGVALSLTLAMLLPWAAPSLPIQPSWWSIVGACFASVAIGLAFGYLPARQASRLDPIVALSKA